MVKTYVVGESVTALLHSKKLMRKVLILLHTGPIGQYSSSETVGSQKSKTFGSHLVFRYAIKGYQNRLTQILYLLMHHQTLFRIKMLNNFPMIYLQYP